MIPYIVICSHSGILFGTGQHDIACRINRIANLTLGCCDVSLLYEQLLGSGWQFVPIPVGDGVVELIGDIVDDQFRICR